MCPLHIYKASAGSGKTYALTLAYLKLLFRHPEAYRHILAVTFTNKAAGEMKGRILARLYQLSRAREGDELDDLHTLKRELGMEEKDIIARSAKLLQGILNDYSAFSVGTIDKFFQSVIRAFTREMGIQPGYNLELDHQRVLTDAIDQLFQDIGHDQGLRRWLSRFAEERMDEAKSWNFRQDMEELGKQLFRESFQLLFSGEGMEALSKDHLEHFRSELDHLGQQSQGEIRSLGQKALDAIAAHQLRAEDFKGASRSPAFLFEKARTEGALDFLNRLTPLKAMADEGLWLKKDATEAMTRLTGEELMPLLGKIYEQQCMSNSLKAIRANFYTLGILSDLRGRVQQSLRERNLFLLADSSRFLRGIINGNQVPFIYEKTGLRFQHIMLDEFQDTSMFQYENFKPLLDNALASGHENLVVGDIKQSIYRWRNSDWLILSEELERDFKHQEIKDIKLGMNYRSKANIVRFNNTLFQLAPGELDREVGTDFSGISQAYAGAVQQLPAGTEQEGGYVRAEFITGEEDRKFHEQVLDRLPGWIDQILDSGVEPGEIAILVRRKKEGVQVAEKLLQHALKEGDINRYRLISSESLLLEQSDAVSLLLALLRYLAYPADQVNRALLKLRCSQLLPEAPPIHAAHFQVDQGLEGFLPPAFLEQEAQFRQMPVFELCEQLIALFSLNRHIEDLPYVQAFQDLIIEFQRREAQGIADFLEAWEQQGRGKGVRISENTNAIRILTIHRAKGLEFKAVILPFCNWEISTDSKQSNILWCSTKGTPFEAVPFLPLKYSSILKQSHFSQAYELERTQGYLDKLNLLYVALTRAREVLYLGLPEPSEKDQLKHVGALIPRVWNSPAQLEPALPPLSGFVQDGVLEIGRLELQKAPERKGEEWPLISYPAHAHKRSLNLRLRGHAMAEREYGNLMHLLYSRIHLVKDVPLALQSLVREGRLDRDLLPKLEKEVLASLERPEVRSWFEPAQERRIYTERSLLCRGGEVLRPDRVVVDGRRATVIDYKFGEKQSEAHRHQLKRYREVMEGMNYSQVEGYLWYLNLDAWIKLEPA